MERCPGCRARLGEEALCPRCGCDLSLPLRAERQVRRHLEAAIAALAAGDAGSAACYARAAQTLRDDELNRRISAWLDKLAATSQSAAPRVPMP
jgi:hypothetical protein